MENHEIVCDGCGAISDLYSSTSKGWVAWPLYGTFIRRAYDLLGIRKQILCRDCYKQKVGK